MQTISISILGGDLRQCYLADYMHTMGHAVTCYGTIPFSNTQLQADSLKDAVFGAQLVIGPIPFSKDGSTLFSQDTGKNHILLEELLDILRPGQLLFGGNIPIEMLASLREKHVLAIDLMKDAALTLANAALTAEGLLTSLITETPFSLSGRRLLLLGYGRCGQEIVKLLNCFDMEISVYDKDTSLPFDLAHYDLIINTIPAQILTPQLLKQLPGTCILFDIASAPGGFEHKVIEELQLKLICCPGLPGRFMPKTAGELIGITILERML